MDKLQQYQDWIKANVSLKASFAECQKWTQKMVEAFPELKRVRGHVLLSTGIERTHWWLMAEDGTIVDPTSQQFALPYYGGAAVVSYRPWDESQPTPTGKCPNCGGYCFDGKYLCCSQCEREYTAYCNNPMG